MHHSRTRIPPIDPPTTPAHSTMPSCVGERSFGGDLVADGDDRETRAVRNPVRGRGGGTSRPLTPAEHVGTYDEITFRIEREPRPDEAVPPPGGDVARTGRARRVRIHCQGMENQDAIASFGVERPPLFVCHGDVRQAPPELERQASLGVAEELEEPPPTTSVPGLPYSRAGPLAHAPFAARNPASRSAKMSSMDSMPTESLTRSGDTPVVVCSASVSCEWVVDAGWIARLRTSPTLAK